MYESEVEKINLILDKSSKYFIPYTHGGYSKYTNQRDASTHTLLPNCTGGCYGLAMQVFGTTDYKKMGLPVDDAINWYKRVDTTIWNKVQYPVAGAIACWGGKGKGHVGFVKHVPRDKETGKVNGTPVVLESSFYSYNGQNWREGTPYKYNSVTGALVKVGYTFLGYLVPKFIELDPITPPAPTYKYAVGDKIRIEAAGNSRADGTGKTSYGLGYKRFILEISENSKYPYLVGNKNGVATGWYAENALSLLDHSEPAQTELKVGDKVEIIKHGNARKDGKGKTSYGLGLKRYILKIHEGESYPYQIGNILRITTGYYKEDALKKL